MSEGMTPMMYCAKIAGSANRAMSMASIVFGFRNDATLEFRFEDLK